MLKLINEFSNKLGIPKHLYITDESLVIYKNVKKEPSNISSEIINNKLVEIIEENTVNGERLFLISINGNLLGWVNMNNPIVIYNTFPQHVQVINQSTDNFINNLLELHEPLELEKMYTKKFFVELDGKTFFGICSEDKIISFVSKEQINDGEVIPLTFSFTNNEVTFYRDTNKNISHVFINDGNDFVLDFVLIIKSDALGSFKFGQSRFWFDLKDTNINLDQIIYKDNYSDEYHMLEHLLYTSNNMSKLNKFLYEKKTLEEEIIFKRINNLIEKNNNLQIENKKLKEKFSNE